MIDEEQLRERMQKIAALVQDLDAAADARIRAKSKELIESVMDLHGAALERVLERLHAAGEPGAEILEGLAADPVVASVLLLYGLHPLDLETRVRRALDKIRATLRTLGSDAELTGITAGTVRIRVREVDNAFAARSVKSAIEDELYAAAPDAESLVLNGLEKFAAPDFVPLDKVGVLTVAKGGD
jgi:hypothetical protein